MFASLGGGPVCATCEKPVYFNERVLVAGNLYHKRCFNCMECGHKLELGKQCTHGESFFCKTCYGKKYGPRGYGFGVGAGILTETGYRPEGRPMSVRSAIPTPRPLLQKIKKRLSRRKSRDKEVQQAQVALAHESAEQAALALSKALDIAAQEASGVPSFDASLPLDDDFSDANNTSLPVPEVLTAGRASVRVSLSRAMTLATLKDAVDSIATKKEYNLIHQQQLEQVEDVEQEDVFGPAVLDASPDAGAADVEDDGVSVTASVLSTMGEEMEGEAAEDVEQDDRFSPQVNLEMQDDAVEDGEQTDRFIAPGEAELNFDDASALDKMDASVQDDESPVAQFWGSTLSMLQNSLGSLRDMGSLKDLV